MSVKSFFVLTPLFFISLNLYAQSDTAKVQKLPGPSLAQMVNTLNACDCFIRSIRSPLSAEEHRMITAYSAMSGLNFKTLDSLYTYSGDIIKLYTFGLICSNFPDSLTDQHLLLLKNKKKVRIYQKQQEDFPKERISDIAYELHSTIEKKRLEEIQKDQVEKKIKAFILNYALYPESYIPVSFTGYHQYAIHDGGNLEKEESSEVHAVVHSYKLKNQDGVAITISQTFKLNSDFVIMIIEAEESTTVSCWPPKLDSWLSQFGRVLTESDKEALQLNVKVESPLTKRQIKKLLR